MWEITDVDVNGEHTLNCVNKSAKPDPIIFTLKITQDRQALISINYYSSPPTMLSIETRCRKFLLANNLQSDVFKSRNVKVLELKISIQNDLWLFNQLLDTIKNDLPQFSEIITRLPKFIKADKRLISRTLAEQQRRTNEKFSNRAENTMFNDVFASARASEEALRAKFNFAAPSYIDPVFDDESVLEFDPLRDNPYDFVTEDNDGDPEEEIYNEYYFSDGLLFRANFNYSAEENEAIAQLHDLLVNQCEKLFNDKYLIKILNCYFLSPQSIRLLVDYQRGVNSPEVAIANNALNCSAALRAIELGGSHSHNEGMKQTEIVGYGLRNIVALLWHACNVAKDSAEPMFMKGVTFNDAIEALCRGIADGARGKNRNSENDFDNLQLEDLQACDQGRYNSLISAFNGVFPEVKIIYNYMDLLIPHLANQIVKLLVIEYSDYSIAKKIVAQWCAPFDYLATPDKDYANFILFLNDLLPHMVSHFLNLECPHDLGLRKSIEKDLSKKMNEFEEGALGLSFVESVTISEAEFEKLWQQKHAEPQKRKRESAVETTTNNEAPEPKKQLKLTL